MQAAILEMTSKRIQDSEKKTFALVFEPGEEVTAGLLQFANEHRLASAHLTAIGAFERVILGFFDIARRHYKKIPINEQVELCRSLATLLGMTRVSRRCMLMWWSVSRTERRTADTYWRRTFARRWKSSSWNPHGTCAAPCVRTSVSPYLT
jgi:hypothetical protein